MVKKEKANIRTNDETWKDEGILHEKIFAFAQIKIFP